MSIKAEDIVATTHMELLEAKGYVAILTQIQKFGHCDDANMEIMHVAIMDTAKEKGMPPTRVAIAILSDFRER